MLEPTETLGPNEEAWKSNRGSLRIRRPHERVLVFVEEGHLDAEFAPLITNACDAALGNGPLFLFVDAYDLTGYAPEVRKAPTDWLMSHRKNISVQHMLVRSKLTKMGLSVASLALGGLLRGHISRASFRLALEETVAELSKRTPIGQRQQQPG